MNTPVTPEIPEIILNKVREEEEEAEELDEADDELEDELSELANFKKITVGKPSKPRIPVAQESPSIENNTTQLNVLNLNEKVEITKVDDSVMQNLKIMQARNAKKTNEVKKSRGGRFARKASEDDDDYGEITSFAPRIERFLSIVELPPEILMYTQQLAQQRSKEAADRTKNETAEQNGPSEATKDAKKQTKPRFPVLKPPYGRVDPAKKKKANQKTATSKADEDKEMIRHYRNGAGLSQAAKREIIRDIIRNFDMKKYLSEFKESSVVEITYDKR
jgi:hypothetical protein